MTTLPARSVQTEPFLRPEQLHATVASVDLRSTVLEMAATFVPLAHTLLMMDLASLVPTTPTRPSLVHACVSLAVPEQRSTEPLLDAISASLDSTLMTMVLASSVQMAPSPPLPDPSRATLARAVMRSTAPTADAQHVLPPSSTQGRAEDRVRSVPTTPTPPLLLHASASLAVLEQRSTPHRLDAISATLDSTLMMMDLANPVLSIPSPM